MTNEERRAAIEWLRGRPITMPSAKKMYALAAEALEAYVPDTNVEDMISRQGAMEMLMAQNVIMDGSEYHNGFNAGVNRAQEVIRNLPPVQPKRGYWTESHEHVYMGNVVKEWTNWYCSECDAPNDKPTDFCPNCGADMRGGVDGQN